MEIFVIDSLTSYGSKAMLRILSNADVTFKKAILNVGNIPTESKNPEEWPLIFECESGKIYAKHFRVFVKNITCGYYGTSPHNLEEILRITGFAKYVTEKEIYSQQRIERVIEKN